MLSNIEDQLAKLAELEALEAETIQRIEAEIEAKAQKKVSNRSAHRKAMRVVQVQRARARNKEAQKVINKVSKSLGIVKERFYRTPRSSVIIKKPIEVIDRFKRIEVND